MTLKRKNATLKRKALGNATPLTYNSSFDSTQKSVTLRRQTLHAEKRYTEEKKDAHGETLH